VLKIPLTICQIISSDKHWVKVRLDSVPVESMGDPQLSLKDSVEIVVDITKPGVQMTYMPLKPGDAVIHVAARHYTTWQWEFRGIVDTIYEAHARTPYIKWNTTDKIPKAYDVCRDDVVLLYSNITYNVHAARVREVRQFVYGGNSDDKKALHNALFSILEVDTTTGVAVTSLFGDGISVDTINKWYPDGISPKGFRMQCRYKYLHFPELVVGDVVSVFNEEGRGVGCVKLIVSRCADRADSQYGVCFGPTEGMSFFRRHQLVFPGAPVSTV